MATASLLGKGSSPRWSDASGRTPVAVVAFATTAVARVTNHAAGGEELGSLSWRTPAWARAPNRQHD